MNIKMKMIMILLISIVNLINTQDDYVYIEGNTIIKKYEK